jgi:Glycosyltransferase WbsX
MKKKILPFIISIACLFGSMAIAADSATKKPVLDKKDFTVACYYFPNYHTSDARNAEQFGPGWSEWELVRAAKPRFPGHHQPNVPLWGYTDESDPDAMAQKISAAADHGVDVFIFDWYYFNDGPFLERGLENGFLGAKNNDRIKFSLMWANHNWFDIHPCKLNTEPKLLYPGQVTPETFERMTDHIVETYFKHPSYWKIDGRPYFSIYEIDKLIASFGSIEKTREALDRFEAKAQKAGFPGIHFNLVNWGAPILPGETKPANIGLLVEQLGIDSLTSYVWIHHVPLEFPKTDYETVQDKYFQYWDSAEGKYGVPYYPNVTMGWDSSPRARQSDQFVNWRYPFMGTISGNSPDRFKRALEATGRRLADRGENERILTINCWNEWTEGSYLEPDMRSGMKYLEALRDVFGNEPKPE